MTRKDFIEIRRAMMIILSIVLAIAIAMISIIYILNITSDHYNRQIFISSCVANKWSENTVIKFCNDEYEKYHQLQIRNWKPEEDKN